MTDLNLLKFSCGIRYKHAFRMNDISGEIIDKILYSNKYISSKDFKNVSRDGNGFILYTHGSSDTRDILRMVATDLIYTHVVEKEKGEDIFETCAPTIIQYLVPEVIEKHNLVVERIGFVYQSSIEQELHKKLTAQFFTGVFDESFEYKFSKKAIVTSSCVNANKNDYINKLYSSTRTSDNTHMFSYDYQYFFVPNQAYVSNKIESLLKNSYTSYREDIFDIIV